MAKLIVNPTSSAKREVPLPRSLLSIGRDPSNDLVLPDAMVSRRHAVIEYRGSQYFLRDCNSSNGSLVNGDRVSERSLRDGDLVAIGTARLLFREDVEALDPAAKVVQHPSAPRLHCPSCGADYRKGDLFCKQCGVQLQSAQPKAVCASCGTVVPLPAKFCNACGSRLAGDESLRPESTKHRPGPGGLGLDTDLGPESLVAPPSPGAAPAPSAEAAPRAEDAPPRPSPGEPPAQVRSAEPPLPRPAGSQEATVPPPSKGSPEEPRPMPSVRPSPAPLAERPSSLARPTAGEGAGAGLDKRSTPRRQVASEPADLGRRLVAGLVDLAVVSSGQSLLLAPIAYYWWQREIGAETSFLPILLSLALTLLTGILGAVYFVYFWGERGATPGKQLLGLALEGVDGSFPVGVPRAAARALGYVLSAALLGIGFLMIAIDGRGLHDRIAGTRVVRREGA